MKLSEKRMLELYKSVSEPIMDFRIKHINDGNLENELFTLQMEIWKKVKISLNLPRES